MDYLAERTSSIDASGIRKVFNLAATMTDPVNFSIGQPDFDVPDMLKDEAVKAIRDGRNKYSVTAGEPMLRRRVAEQISRRLGWKKPATLITSGVSGALLLSFMSVVNPGDEVIIPDPYFVMYKHLVNLLGGKCIFIDSYPDFRLPVEKIAAAITNKTKLIVLNSPCNPTGVVYSEQEVKAIAAVASEKDILIITDEIYDKFCYDGPLTSIAAYYDNVILMKGFSKAFAMTGWRLGYVAVKEHLRPLIEAMTMIQQYTFVCAPTPFQASALAAVDYDVSGHVAAYKRKRDLVYEGLRGKFEMNRPGGAFYAFVRAPARYANATEFVEKAIANNVLIIPGNVFSEKDSHFRISYATTDDRIRQGVGILCRLA